MKKQSKTIKISSPQNGDDLPGVVQISLLTRSEGPGEITPRQNRPSLEQTPEADNAGVFPFPKVVVVYDDVSAGQHAIRVLANVFPEPEDRLQLLPRFWRFDFLEDTDWFALALADASDADIIVIATSSNHGPDHFSRRLDKILPATKAWKQRRRRRFARPRAGHGRTGFAPFAVSGSCGTQCRA